MQSTSAVAWLTILAFVLFFLRRRMVVVSASGAGRDAILSLQPLFCGMRAGRADLCFCSRVCESC